MGDGKCSSPSGDVVFTGSGSSAVQIRDLTSRNVKQRDASTSQTRSSRRKPKEESGGDEKKGDGGAGGERELGTQNEREEPAGWEEKTRSVKKKNRCGQKKGMMRTDKREEQ